MLFHTWTFFIFFIVTIVGFWALRPTRFWLHWILLASAVFYGWWHPYYLLLVFYSTVLDYFIVGRPMVAGGVWTISAENVFPSEGIEGARENFAAEQQGSSGSPKGDLQIDRPG